MIRLGLTMPLAGFGLSRSLEIAGWAEQLGYDDLWTTEVMSHDGFAMASAVAARTTHARVGVGLVPAFTRSPGVIAMAAATVEEISEGRAVLGIGGSNRKLVEDGLGASYPSPALYLAELVDVLRMMFSGERIEYAGSLITVNGFKLGLGPVDVPIMLGAVGPRMLKLTGEEADGLLTHLVPAERLSLTIAAVVAAAVDAGKSTVTEVVSRVPVSIGGRPEATAAMFDRYLVDYPYASGSMRETVIAAGSADAVMGQLAEYVRAGATTVVIAPSSAADSPREREREIRHAIEEIASRRVELSAT